MTENRKYTVFQNVILLLSLINVIRAASSADTPKEYAVSSKEMILQPRQVFNFSGSVTVRPDLHQFGFCDSYSPPFAANPFQAVWAIDNQPIQAADYTWHPAEMVATGIPENGVSAALHITPLPAERAFVCRLVLENKGPAAFQKTLSFEMAGEIQKTDQWGWMQPVAGGSAPVVQGRKNGLTFTSKESELTAVFQPSPTGFKDNKSPWFSIDLLSGRETCITAVIVLGGLGETYPKAAALLDQADDKVATAVQAWAYKIKMLRDRLPRLITGDEGLQRFYQRGLLTFLTTRWDLGGLALSPWYAESGIDGGAVCNYLWGDAYISKFLALADPVSMRALLMTSINADYSRHYAIDPLTGAGLGVGYSYDCCSMALMVYDYIAITGDIGILQETVHGEPFLDALYRYVFEQEDMSRPPVLIDYGTNENLLELHRTQAYQHYTPSPNGERLLIYRMVDEMYRWAGRKAPVDFKARGTLLRRVLMDELWDQDLKWFRCLDQERKPRVCYSIQIFDLLREELLSPEQAKGLVGHLNEREFLSQWGVHSLSKVDPGYDPSDIDWGGPGVYAGDGPELAADLLGSGFAGQGVDVLRRILWWGEFPYIPQAVRADSRDYRRDGRANVIAALAGPQAVVWGLFGIRVDGEQLTIRPAEHPYTAGMGVENLKIRGHNIRITIDPDGRNYTVEADGQAGRKPMGQPYVLKFE